MKIPVPTLPAGTMPGWWMLATGRSPSDILVRPTPSRITMFMMKK